MDAVQTTSQSAILRKVSLRLIPFMLLLYVIAYLDRINISFAGLQMNKDLGFTPEIFGLGSGAFFIGYFLFGVPSNVMVAKLGARKWIAIIMVAWGLLSTAFVEVKNVETFYLLRFLIGVAEAGFFPGMILYLTYWFPRREHAQAVSRFMTAIPLAGILGGLVASQVLQMHGILGLPGWKWLFLITGLPAIIFGFVVFFCLSDGPADCKWLSADERNRLCAFIEDDRKGVAASAQSENVFGNPKVWTFAILYFLLTLGMYGFQLWLPQIIESFGKLTDSTAALLSAIPAVFQAAGMILVARNSDRTAERRLHVASCAWLAASSLVLCAFCKDPILSLICLCASAFGLWGVVGPFWALPTTYLGHNAKAAGIGLINSVGNLGGFAGPYLVGFIRQRNPDFMYSLFALAAPLVVAGIIVSFLRTEMAESSDKV